MLDENPFLELSEDGAPAEEFGLAQSDARPQQDEHEADQAALAATPQDNSPTPSDGTEAGGADLENALTDSWEGDGSVEVVPDDGEWGGEATARKSGADADDGSPEAGELSAEHESLQAHLHRQALALRLSDEDRAALRFLIESLNDDGYLEDSLQSLAEGLGDGNLEDIEELVQRFTMALKLLQTLEPSGVGAATLAECLALQLRALPDDPARAAAMAIVGQPIEILAKRDVKRLAALCGLTEAAIKQGIGLITRLDPKPGRRFINVERNVIVPDVIVLKVGRGFRVQLNSDVMPRLKVHDVYAGALKAHKGEGGAQALQQRLQEARWFIKNIQQRFDTILRVSSAIVERQKSFFVHGALAMRPLVLREIADELGLHESTISRVTTAKYMATPFGTYELKYFFGSALNTETGGNASSTAVRALIKQFVSAENPSRPLSDNQLSEMLKEQGIACARRTVAKYREALRIAPTNLRKTL